MGTGRGHVAALIFTKEVFREDVKRAEWRSGCFIGGGMWSHTESDLFSFVSQGIEWTHIDYFNNAIICDLIENVSIGYSFLKNCLIIISHLKWSQQPSVLGCSIFAILTLFVTKLEFWRRYCSHQRPDTVLQHTHRQLHVLMLGWGFWCSARGHITEPMPGIQRPGPRPLCSRCVWRPRSSLWLLGV